MVGAELSASLLFLIAQRSSDAYEASREISAAGEPNAIRRAMILAIGRFARGQFGSLLEIDAEQEILDTSNPTDLAADLLLFHEAGIHHTIDMSVRVNADGIIVKAIDFATEEHDLMHDE